MIFLLLAIIVFLFATIFSQKKPDLFFWITLLLVVDPGGYITFYGGELLPGYLRPTDFLSPLLFLPLFSPQVSLTILKQDVYSKKILRYLFFLFLYFMFIYGLIIPQNSFLPWLRFIYIKRYQLFAPLLFIPSFIFAYRSLDLFYKTTVLSGTVILSIYIISLITSIDFVPMWKSERFTDSGIIRSTLYSYGNIQLTTYLSLTLVFMKEKLPFKQLLYFCGIVMLFIVLLSLTRGTTIITFVRLFLVIWVVAKLKRINISKYIVRTSIIAAVFILSFSIFFGTQSQWIKETYTRTYLELTGQIEEGSTQSRTLYEIPRQIAVFKQYPLFGAGYQEKYNQGALKGESLDVNDTPYIGVWSVYGVFGVILILISYYIIFKNIKSCYKLIRMVNIKQLFFAEPYALSLFLIYSIIFIGTFIFPNNIFVEYTKSAISLGTMIAHGILFASIFRLKIFIFYNEI